MGELNSIWSTHQRKLANGKEATVKKVTNAFISLIGAITTSGSSTVATAASAAFATYGAAESGIATARIDFDLDLDTYQESLSMSLCDGWSTPGTKPNLSLIPNVV